MEIEKVNEEILEDDEVEVSCDTSTFDLECYIQQMQVDFGIICGVYIYADKEGKINVTKIGLEKHIEILEAGYLNHMKEKECQE